MKNNLFATAVSISRSQKVLSSLCATTVIILIVLLFAPICHSQNLLNAPQKIVIDRSHNRLLVSNYYSGDLIEINSSGILDTFVLAADFVDGMEIVGDTVYGSGSHKNIRAYDLNTKALVMDIIMPSPNPVDEYLSSITSDSAGHLFISCPELNTIYKMRISDTTYWVFAKDNGLNRPNGMLLEKEKNRLVVIDDSPNSIIHAISLADSTVSTLMTTSFNSPDGIVRDRFGSYYVGGYYLPGIYKIDSSFSSPPRLFYPGSHFVYPTYDEPDHSLLVTLFEDNLWERIPLQVFDFVSDYQTGHAPLTVQFSQIFETLQPVTSWSWDFENDGIFDSNLPNPAHEYSQPGTYTVRLKATIDTATYDIVKEDFINVFNGMSAVKFDGDESYVYFPAIPSFNLVDNFTVEMVIKPDTWGDQLYGGTLFDKSAIRLFIIGHSFGPTGDYSLVADLKLQDGTQVKLSAPNNTINLNIWQHIAVSYNASLNQFKMYVNGVERTVNVVGSNQLAGALLDNHYDKIYIGNNPDLSRGYNGSFDEFRLWSSVRNGADILDNMDNSLAGNETGLIGYWQMDEGKGTELVDKTATGNYGQIVSAVFTNGVDLSTLSEINENDDSNKLPKEFCLKQNYPNPFNPSTTIEYQLESQSYVKIIITNILGETVSILEEGLKNAGNHKCIFNVPNLSSGIYYYQLVAGNYRETKKMILLR